MEKFLKRRQGERRGKDCFRPVRTGPEPALSHACLIRETAPEPKTSKVPRPGLSGLNKGVRHIIHVLSAGLADLLCAGV